MKLVMKETVQFGSVHYKEGETVYKRRIGRSSDYILSKRKSQPVGPTVSREYLNRITELVEE